MTEFPKGVRLAQAGDEKRLFDLCFIAHEENGWGSMDPETVNATIRKATQREGCVIAIIDGPERVEAAIGLQPTVPWFCKSDIATNWYWCELFWYVHPLHRRSRHAVKLFRFTQWWEEQIHAPVLISLMPREDLEKKEKLCARFGTHIGSTFLIGNGKKTYAEVASNV
ncbi:MAG TPA: hypothetical protein VH024_17535 [Candidatus Angelobacter sp.]|jgi:hypothetical protein|nr:hypothetical protein [Candidatus Angelobacter sp.]